ncbi:MAG: hypothetical protein ACI8XO_003235 [Verrucomicrobiales bacterium]|jgi:hypothetical protein
MRFMYVTITERNSGAIVEVATTDKLHKQDYEKWTAAFCRPFNSGKVIYFERTEKADATESGAKRRRDRIAS